MKRILAVFLVLVLLLPLCFAQAEDKELYTAEEVYSRLSAVRKKIMCVMWTSHRYESDYDENEVYTVDDVPNKYSLSGSEMKKLYDMLMGNAETSSQEKSEKSPLENLQNQIELSIKYRLKYSDVEFWKVDFDHLTVAPYDDTDGKVSVRIYLSWSANNGADRTKKMLEMYSDDLAATLAEEYKDKDFFIAEVWFFWEVPNIIKTGYASKYQYDNMMNKMYRVRSMGPLYGNN